MNIHIRSSGQMVVDDELDGRDVETSCRDISGDEDRRRGGIGEAFDGSKSTFLRHLRVQSVGRKIQVLQEGCESAN